ncbi:MAG TPA: carbohydrate ABC transporter substrate-binding protein [Anaerolineae bacterium]
MLARRSWMVLITLVALALIAGACAGPAPTPPPIIQTAAPVIQTVIQTAAPVVQTVVQTVVVGGTPQVQVITATPPPPKPVPTGPGTKSITVIANWTGGEREAFQAVLDAFSAKTGVQIAYESARDNLEAVVRTRVAGGNPPDIAMEPRPGALAEFARANNLIQLDASGKEVIKPADLSAAFGQSYIDLGKVDGKLYGLIFKADSKSTFWYKPASFKALGVDAPKTLDDLMAIAAKYKAAGKVPFAVGGKDGWVLTDYFENIYARVATPQQYNDLHVTHKVAWTDPTVKKALTTFSKFFQAGYNPGGTQGVLGTGFTDSIAQVFGANPSAEMFYEGGFVGTIATTTFTNLKAGTDLDFFLFPQVDPTFDDPIIGGGDFAMMFKDTPEGRSFMQYLASKEAAEVFAGTNSISPNKLIDVKKFTSPLRAKEYQTLASAKTFLFDGSDMAPSALGGDFEFTELQKLVQNPNNVDQIATELENFAKTAY